MKYLLQIALLAFLLTGCGQKPTPRPRGFFRIDFPEKQYRPLGEKYPYQFEVPHYALIKPDQRNPGKANWINVTVPANKAEVHISYYNLSGELSGKGGTLAEFMEESRRLAYKHAIRANAIEEQIFMNPGREVFGTIYRIKGNAASPLQFFLTDSTNHFLRGALYIRATPDIDSLQPVVDFLEKDIIRIIETTHWD